MYRKTWLEVNLDAIEDNVRTIHAICGKRFIAVLKADAYGCGDIEVADAVLRAGADMLAVSSLDEAMMLRNQGCNAEILILGATDPKDAQLMQEENITVAAYSPEYVSSLAEYGCAGLKVHLAIDSGMTRIGFRSLAESQTALQTLLGAGAVVTGIFTHFSCSDFDPDFTNHQYQIFADTVRGLNYNFDWIHCDNSDATINFKDPLSNGCRVGISLYGISTYKDDLKRPLSFYSTVVMVKQVHAGDKVGYGATYTAKEGEWIATVPVGYADGFVRANQGRHVYVDGQQCEIVGRICMDQMMIRLPYQVPVGTRVELFGEHIRLEDMAKDLNTIPYEIICLLSGRVTRTYVEHGQVISEANERLTKSIHSGE